MTCVVGLVSPDNKVYIGADSAGSDGSVVVIRKDSKVFRNGRYLMGFTSSFRLGDLLKYAFNPPEYEDRENQEATLEQFMATEFIDKLRKCLSDGGYATKSNEVEYGGNFLVGYKGRLFTVESDYQIGENFEGYDAIGCGSQVARGALFVSPRLKPVQRVKRALEAAAHHCNSVRSPFRILCSDGSEY